MSESDSRLKRNQITKSEMIRNEDIMRIELMKKLEGTIEEVPEFITKMTSESETYLKYLTLKFGYVNNSVDNIIILREAIFGFP